MLIAFARTLIGIARNADLNHPGMLIGLRTNPHHPGVGPIVSLAHVLTIGEWQRFARGKHVARYLGLTPAEDFSSDKRRLGHISKQGNSLVRWLLVEAALNVQRFDVNWHRQYVHLPITKHHGVAKVAIADKLAIRLYWMLRSGDDYQQIKEHGSHAGQSASTPGAVSGREGDWTPRLPS